MEEFLTVTRESQSVPGSFDSLNRSPANGQTSLRMTKRAGPDVSSRRASAPRR